MIINHQKCENFTASGLRGGQTIKAQQLDGVSSIIFTTMGTIGEFRGEGAVQGDDGVEIRVMSCDDIWELGNERFHLIWLRQKEGEHVSI